MQQSTDYQDKLKTFLEPPITNDEKDKSKIIRRMLKNKEFDELYKVVPEDIAKLINSKYRVLNI